MHITIGHVLTQREHPGWKAEVQLNFGELIFSNMYFLFYFIFSDLGLLIRQLLPPLKDLIQIWRLNLPMFLVGEDTCEIIICKTKSKCFK